MTQVGEDTLKVKTTCSTCEAQKNGQTEGHPIDVASGRVFTVAKDLTFARPFMLKIFRTWLSTNKDRKGLFGPGWSTLLDTSVKIYPNDITYYDDEYQSIEFPKIGIGETSKMPSMGVTLARQEQSMEVTDSQGRTFHFAMDPDTGKSTLEWITKNGIDLIYLEYDRGLLSGIKDAAGNHYPIQRDYENRISDIYRHVPGEKPARLRTYRYDKNDRLTQVRDELDHTTTYGYNDDNLLIQETDRNGFSFYYEYDSENRCIKNVGDNGKYLRKFQYLPKKNKTVVTYSHGHKKTYWYKYTGLVEMTEDALGHTSQRHHDENGYLISAIDKNVNIYNYENDDLGREIERVDAHNKRWRTVYKDTGVTKKDPLDNAIAQTRDRNGNLIREQDQNGHFIEHHYDHQNRRTARTSNDKHRQYDPWNRLLRETDPLGHETRQEYDLKGRLLSHCDALNRSTSYAYDPEDNVHTITDPLGYKQRFNYQDNHELVEQIDANNNRTKFSYNQEGRIERITNANNETHSLAYDPLDRIIKSIGFDGQVNRYTYDPEDNIIRVDKADGAIFHIDYNRVKQPVKIKAVDPDGAVSRNHYTYDPAGRLIQAENEHSKVELEYDALGRVINECQNGYLIENAYDTAGNLVLQKNSFGHSTQFEYDANNRLAFVTLGINKQIRIVRDAAGRPIERHLPGNIHSKCTHDPTGKLLTQAIYIGSGQESHLLAGRKYTWDQRGKLTDLEDENRDTKRFTYDPAGQVTKVSHQFQPDRQYDFDSFGNIRQGTYESGNRLATLNGKQYRYDSQGNTTYVVGEGAIYKRSFNVFNQLVSVNGNDGTQVEFLYDAFGRRINKKTPEQEIRYYWDQFKLASEHTDETQTDYTYYPDTFVPLCCYNDGDAYFYQTDHLGTPMEITDERGNLVWTGHYDTFGACHVDESSTFENNIRFQGQYHDKETGLLYNCFRYYDPEAKRYISQDPISYLSGDYNLYRYCSNDPVNMVDPVGLGPIVGVLAVGTLILTVITGLIAQKYLEENPPIFKSDPFPSSGDKTESSSKTEEKCSTADPGNDDDGDEKDEVEKLTNDKDTSPGKKTKGKTTQYERPGGERASNNDFDKLNPENTKDINTKYGPGRTGKLSDGRSVTVRPGSSDGRPTLEIRKPNGRGIEIRYN